MTQDLTLTSKSTLISSDIVVSAHPGGTSPDGATVVASLHSLIKVTMDCSCEWKTS